MTTLKKHRKLKDKFLRTDRRSPLQRRQRRAFKGLRYFPENEELRFEVVVEKFTEQESIQIRTSTGQQQPYTRHGLFRFEVDGEPAQLTVYMSGDGNAFVPFTDATTGAETYAAGRYLDLDHQGGDQYEADFNLAYNPWCAYSPDFSCPIPPEENKLSVPIRAGEKDYKR